MLKFLEDWRRSRREARALVNIVDAMKAEDALVFADLERQLREKFAAMTAQEREEAAQKLHRAIGE